MGHGFKESPPRACACEYMEENHWFCWQNCSGMFRPDFLTFFRPTIFASQQFHKLCASLIREIEWLLRISQISAWFTLSKSLSAIWIKRHMWYLSSSLKKFACLSFRRSMTKKKKYEVVFILGIGYYDNEKRKNVRKSGLTPPPGSDPPPGQKFVYDLYRQNWHTVSWVTLC